MLNGRLPGNGDCGVPYELHTVCKRCERIVHAAEFCELCAGRLPPQFRAELVVLITEGATYGAVLVHFREEQFEAVEIDGLLHEAGVQLPHAKDFDGITDERRHELQALSLAE